MRRVRLGVVGTDAARKIGADMSSDASPVLAADVPEWYIGPPSTPMPPSPNTWCPTHPASDAGVVGAANIPPPTSSSFPLVLGVTIGTCAAATDVSGSCSNEFDTPSRRYESESSDSPVSSA